MINRTPDNTTDLRTALTDWAEHVEVIPSRFRADIVWAALQFAPSGSLEQSNFVGFHRALFWRCLEADPHSWPVPAVQRIVIGHAAKITEQLRPLEACADVSSVRLILGDLLGFLHLVAASSAPGQRVGRGG